MARIQLRDATLLLQDGTSGTGTINGALTGGESTIPINAATLNTTVTDQVPVGARFTLLSADEIYTVTSRTPSSGTTTSIGCSPVVLTAEADASAIVYLAQRLTIKVGEGDISWTEAREFIYDRDRDVLDTVRLGQDQPISVDASFTFEFITAETGKTPTPVDALNQDGEASEWVSSATDLCEPYSVDIVILHCQPCGADQDQDILLPDFRYESLDYSVADASIAFSGQCNATRATVVRSQNLEC